VGVSEDELGRLVPFLKVLADRNRLRVLGLLAEREYTVRELAQTLGVTEPTVSSHLNMLKLHGMVEMRQAGTSHPYRLRQEGVHALLKDLSAQANTFADADENSSDFDRRVLRHFFVNGRLKEIPVTRSRQIAVVRRLVQEFRFGEHYPEKQVNEILKRFHPDCATLRRQMIDFRFMARENGLYWRLEDDAPPTESSDGEGA
jgi:DNA-binding transcriptional ArsR family regulator